MEIRKIKEDKQRTIYESVFMYSQSILGMTGEKTIIIYNKNRRKRKKAADILARKRIEELRRGEGASTGHSFEEIEDRHRANAEETSKLLSADRPEKSGKTKIENLKDLFRR